MIKDKNILFIRKKKKSTYYDMLEKAIIEFGQPRNCYYIEHDSNSNCYAINTEIKKTIKEKKINIFIVLGYYYIDPDLLFNNQEKLYRIRIDGDDPVIFDFYSRWYAQLFDLNITHSLLNKLKFNEYSFNSIIYVGNISNKNTIANLNKENIFYYDVSFIGYAPAQSKRENYINFIKKNNINISLFGHNYNTKYLSTNEKYNTYTKSKININFANVKLNKKNYDELNLLKDDPQIENKLNMTGRVFEVLSVKGFLLTEYNPTLEYFFEIDKDLVVFYNETDLINKIKYYLNNENERNKIAQSGYDKFQSKYEYSKWSPYFVKEIEKNFQNKNIIKSYLWPKKIKRFNNRFLNKKYFFNIKYIYMILKNFDVLYLITDIFKKIFVRLK